jgi:hypothetical protein
MPIEALSISPSHMKQANCSDMRDLSTTREPLVNLAIGAAGSGTRLISKTASGLRFATTWLIEDWYL